jgi:hypothetical protein
MKLLTKSKDGGPESTVTGYFLIEWKALFSIVLLRFDRGSRDAYHSHAFNCVSWVLSGALGERHYEGDTEFHWPSFKPIVTRRSTYHKVVGLFDTTWVLSVRGPWAKTWRESTPAEGECTLTSGRKKV